MVRRSLRAQLTLLYAVPFVLSGIVLVSIPLLGASQSAPVGSGLAPDVADDALRNRLLAASAVGLAAMVVVSVLVGWLVAGRFLRPLRTITTTARDISASNLHRRLGRTGRRDEFSVLAETLDDLFARLEAAFESQRRFVANASHELRTPLTAERALLQVALGDPDASVASLRAACREVLSLGRAQERLIDALLALASSEQGIERHEPLDLAGIADGVIRDRAEEAERLGIHVAADLSDAPAAGDPRLAESLVANLIDNALRHNVPGGRVEVRTATRDGRARLAVRNTGPVIPPDQVERLFEPFQRLDGQRIRHSDGHGLGLAIVRSIVAAHGGTLTAEPRPGGGLAVEVALTSGEAVAS
jgi:signal transduction histidine kinase